MIREQNESRRYAGPERRSGQDRRKVAHRREEFRFEPAKPPRRSGEDRRRGAGWDDSHLR
jgi:hypothetical protein